MEGKDKMEPLDSSIPLVLNDINPFITEAWHNAFDGAQGNIKIITGKFQDLPKPDRLGSDKKIFLTTAGNSFGIMGGGLDLQVATYFTGIQKHIFLHIERTYRGEMPVGAALTIGLEPQHAPFIGVFYVPTMRAPIRLYTTETVYLATRAALVAFNSLVYFSRSYGEFVYKDAVLVLPGFGGNCGQVKPHKIAAAMRLAWDNFNLPRSAYPNTTREMQDWHKKIGATNA